MLKGPRMCSTNDVKWGCMEPGEKSFRVLESCPLWDILITFDDERVIGKTDFITDSVSKGTRKGIAERLALPSRYMAP